MQSEAGPVCPAASAAAARTLPIGDDIAAINAGAASAAADPNELAAWQATSRSGSAEVRSLVERAIDRLDTVKAFGDK